VTCLSSAVAKDKEVKNVLSASSDCFFAATYWVQDGCMDMLVGGGEMIDMRICICLHLLMFMQNLF